MRKRAAVIVDAFGGKAEGMRKRAAVIVDVCAGKAVVREAPAGLHTSALVGER